MQRTIFEYHIGKARSALKLDGSPAREAAPLESPCLKIKRFGLMVAMVALLLSIMIF
jgi:hypothetical protein